VEWEKCPVYAAAVIWVAVFGGIALVGLLMLISYAVWLAHKAADVLSEVAVLADRADQLADLLGQIQPPSDLAGPPRWHSDLIVPEELSEQSAT
jgi:hypothetical protein